MNKFNLTQEEKTFLREEIVNKTSYKNLDFKKVEAIIKKYIDPKCYICSTCTAQISMGVTRLKRFVERNNINLYNDIENEIEDEFDTLKHELEQENEQFVNKLYNEVTNDNVNLDELSYEELIGLAKGMDIHYPKKPKKQKVIDDIINKQ